MGQTENTQRVTCIRLPADQQSSNTQPASGALKREEWKAARLPVCPSIRTSKEFHVCTVASLCVKPFLVCGTYSRVPDPQYTVYSYCISKGYITPRRRCHSPCQLDLCTSAVCYWFTGICTDFTLYIDPLKTKKSEIAFLVQRSPISETALLLESSQIRLFVLVRTMCRCRWIWNTGGIILTGKT